MAFSSTHALLGATGWSLGVTGRGSRLTGNPFLSLTPAPTPFAIGFFWLPSTNIPTFQHLILKTLKRYALRVSSYISYSLTTGEEIQYGKEG